jgi:glycosyltransferase involved in cell wall biosynthesis
MRLGFDMQALQSVNSVGGIGVYNRSLLGLLFKEHPENTYELFFNGLYDGKRPFDDSPNTHSHTVRYFRGNDLNPLNQWVQVITYRAARLDILHVLSPLEHQVHTVISSRTKTRIVATVYDFIPFIFKDLYLPSALHLRLYRERVRLLKSAAMMLSISEATRRDAIELFDLPPSRIVNIGIAPSSRFRQMLPSESGALQETKTRLGIEGKFVLTVTNLDHRKNFGGVLRAFQSLPTALLKEHSLVVVCNSDPKYVEKDKTVNELLNRPSSARIKILYSISTTDLITLYNTCQVFVFASLYEGGGLPVVEAMRCGAPVVASNTSSIPEYVGRTDNLFDPLDIEAIAHSIARVLDDEAYRQELARYGQSYSDRFSWDQVVEKTVRVYKTLM